MRPVPEDSARRFYDRGWNAFVDGKPYALGTRSWRDGWMDAHKAKATEHMGDPPARMTEEQIKHMVNRFLGWQLPKNFAPDAGISYTPFGRYAMPSGTNLFDATQADAMVRYMVEDMPPSVSP